MEKLLMCRICLSEDILLRLIVNTHLQEMYESLTMMPFVTEDSSPTLACDLCCAKLEISHELKRRCLQSEEMFKQLLRSNAQVNLRKMADMPPSVETTLNAVDSDEEQREAPEDARDGASSGSEDDTGTCSMIRTEPKVDYVVPINFEEDQLEGDDNSIQYSDSKDIKSLAVFKNKQSDVTANARDDSSASSGSEDDTGTCSMIRTEPKVDYVVPINFEEDQLEGNDNSIHYSDSEDIMSLAVVKKKQCDVTANARDESSASAGAEDDTGTCSMIRTEPKVDYVVPINFEEDQLEGNDNSIHYSDSEDIMSLAVVKKKQSDVTANARDESSASAGAEDDTGTCSMIRTEPKVDYVVPINFEEDQLEGDDNSIHYSDSEDIMSLAVVKKKQCDVTANARDESSASAGAEDDTGTCSMIRTEPKVDYVVPINFEEDQLEGDDNSIHYSDSEDIMSLAVVKKKQSDVTANARDESSASAGAEDDTGTCSMIRTEPKVDYVVPINFEEDQLTGDDNSIQYSDSEDILSLAVVKNEQSDVTASAPVPKKLRVDAHTNREDKSSKNLKRSDQSKDKIEEKKSETKKAVQDKPVRKRQRVEACDKLHIKLHNNKQNNSTSDHNDVHKEISANNIRAHQSVNSNSSNELKQFVCDTCQKCFNRKWVLVGHIRTHTGEKPYQCHVCKKCFNVKSNLITHNRIHSGEKPNECNVCKKRFSNKYKLNSHIRIHTGEKPYQCNVCHKFFSQKDNLKTHIRIHIGEKPYKCNVCKKSFRQKGRLNTHIRIHSGQKPYQCNVCKKSFSEKSNLIKHIRMHSGEKLYQCNVCKKSFTRKEGLLKHSRTHTGEKPYQCNVCEKRFNNKYNLNSHIRIHTGEKPYQCNVCQKSFNQKGYLNIHNRSHIGEKPYQCNVCKKCFCQKGQLKTHIRIHKGVF